MRLFSSIFLAATIGFGICSTGCETSHTETDKPNMLGGRTHEETTTTKNPITGDTSVEHKKEVTR